MDDRCSYLAAKNNGLGIIDIDGVHSGKNGGPKPPSAHNRMNLTDGNSAASSVRRQHLNIVNPHADLRMDPSYASDLEVSGSKGRPRKNFWADFAKEKWDKALQGKAQ